MSNQAEELDQQVADKESVFDMSAKEKWKNQEAEGVGSIHKSMPQIGALAVDESLAGTCTEYLSQFDIDGTGHTILLRWCSVKWKGSVMELGYYLGHKQSATKKERL
eukprot:10535568-Ditylum_brightwellii.AAC.1